MKLILELFLWTLITVVYVFLRFPYLKCNDSKGIFKLIDPIFFIPLLAIIWLYDKFRVRKPKEPIIVTGLFDEKMQKHYIQIRTVDESGHWWSVNVYSDNPMETKVF